MSKETDEQSESSNLFDSKNADTNLGSKAISGGVMTVSAQIVQFLFQLAGTSILARILVPADFGLVGKVAAVVGVALVTKELGLSIATVQKKDINEDQISTLFWINVGAGLLIMAIIFAMALPLKSYYGDDPRVFWIVIAQGVIAFIGTTAVQHLALLKRKMQFRKLAILMTFSQAIGIVAAIAMAPVVGYWAILVQQFVASAARAVGSWVTAAWVPGRPTWNSSIQSMVSMGGKNAMFGFVGYFGSNTDRILIGKGIGESALGLYLKSNGLIVLPLQQIFAPLNSVAIPALSRLQDDPERYRRFFIKGFRASALLQFPIFGFAAAMAIEVILLVLGPKWIAAEPIFLALMPAAFMRTTAPATSWVFLSLGQTGRQLKLVIVGTICTIIGYSIGIQYGVLGVAIGYSTVACLIRIPSIMYAFAQAPLQLVDVGDVVWRPMTSSVIAGLLIWAIKVGGYFPDMLLLKLIIAFAIFMVAYLAIYQSLPGGRKELKGLYDLVNRYLNQRLRRGGSVGQS